MQQIVRGKYQHFKGNFYEVLYLGKHSETLEDVVIYKALYGDGGIWVRPAKMWNEMVVAGGKSVSRFTLVEKKL